MARPTQLKYALWISEIVDSNAQIYLGALKLNYTLHSHITYVSFYEHRINNLNLFLEWYLLVSLQNRLGKWFVALVCSHTPSLLRVTAALQDFRELGFKMVRRNTSGKQNKTSAQPSSVDLSRSAGS